MNWLVDHPKQLIHLVCFVNMPHFSRLKSGSTRSSYTLGECVAWRAARLCLQPLARYFGDKLERDVSIFTFLRNLYASLTPPVYIPTNNVKSSYLF